MARADAPIQQEGARSPAPCVAEAIVLLDTVPGVGEHVALTIVAEIGVDRGRLPTADHLASWAGRCPGHHAAAGKRNSGRTTTGSPSLRAALVQAAWAARHTRGTAWAAPYRRLVKRRGKKQALVAVGHSILRIVSHVLGRQQS